MVAMNLLFETYLNNTEALVACAFSKVLMPELSLMLAVANLWVLRTPSTVTVFKKIH